MSTIATYSFLPWVRQGIANQIEGQSGSRATIPVELKLSGETLDNGTETRPAIKKNIQIYGPGDITGIEPKAIVRMEPRNWITNFEPNYLPFIEFYDEDLPWRYSPLNPQDHNRLQPWIMLVVLKEDEFKDGKNIKDRPVPYIRLESGAKLPPPEQLWAWSHVHVNKNLIDEAFESTDAEAIQGQLVSVLDDDPDMAYSRIVCPRKLEADTSYHGFLVPVFESGSLAGLGEDPTGVNHNKTAWGESIPQELPYYHRYYFKTGSVGDFEYLVRLLEPKPVDSRVGLRDMDVQKPGANIVGITDDSDATEEQKLGGILKLGGALRIPDIFYSPEEFEIVEKYRNWATLNGTEPYPHPFQEDLAAFINLTDDYEEVSAEEANSNAGINEEQTVDPEEGDPTKEYDIGNNPDPLITAPLYGRWHALTKRLLKERDDSDISTNDNWIHDLNLDPRWRVSSGFGTKVVQENQENYMNAAWEQIGEVLESNKKIRAAQLAKEVTHVWHQTHLKPVKENQPQKWAMLAAPLQSRITNNFEIQENGETVTQNFTVFHHVNQSRIPRAALSTQMRKYLRPRGTLMKRLPFDENITPDNLLERINEGDVSAAPERETPSEIPILDDLYDRLRPKNLPGLIVDLLEKKPWLKWLPLILAVLIIIILLFVNPGTAFYSVGVAIAAGLIYLYRQFNKWNKQQSVADSVREENQTPESVDDLPNSPDFRISTLDEDYTPTIGTEDNETASNFKQALKDAYTLVEESVAASQPKPKPALDISLVNDVMFETLDPEITIPRWVWGSVLIPDRIIDQLKEEFVEAMAYPEIDLPMYKPLVDYSSELFLPNINFIDQNSISLLETNQKFIESYMVGLNHEFARELLWREYPTDQRGSYFRQFWEARSFINSEGLSEEELKEKLKDIPELHLWSKFSDLGDHDHREAEGEDEEEVVLVIRGELLKRYPNAVIYAQRAAWKDEEGDPILDGDSDRIDPEQERALHPLEEDEEENPPRDILKSPLYEAKVEPDIYFFGFDLTVCEAKGGTGKEDEPVDERCADEGITWDDPGWFFVIKERPGEPRFGLDTSEEGNVDGDNKVEVWNDLTWTDIQPGDGFIEITEETATITSDQPLESDDDEKEVQQNEDKNLTWHKDMSSAELAYILYQVPVLVAVHASEMLPEHEE